ncbi:MAG: DUF1549 domain-containing protein, partial [Armatimonadetes bacterium]|nr:DUF1549 domain-containing protein [Armatimonadota bacterium]
MTARVSPTGVLALAALCLALPAASNGPRPPAPGSRPAADPQAQEFFEKKVRPVLVQHCFSCHSDRTPTPAGGLRLDQREFMTKGGGRGPAVRPGRPEESLLLRAVLHQSPAPKMPPAGPLPQEAIADLTTWIRNGASWGAAAGPGTATLAERRAHWAFQPLKPVRPAPVRNRAWVQTPVDAFLLARLERAGWKPAPPAPRSVWLRRVTFDLLGLPPTPQELREFQNDASPQAFEKVVDRLLASPHYGERWARHWLDLVRYAETDGHEFDFEKPGAYHYRDYVVRALNQDVPYDQFVREHLAGDLLAEPRRHPTQGFNESVLGTGFWWLGEGKHSPVDLREEEAERTDNQLDVFGKAFLGLSLGCARCHDHKFDPISTKDYYALFGYLRSSRYQLVDVADPEKARTAAAGLSRLREKLGRPLTATVSRQLLAALPGLHQRLRSALAAPAPEKAAGPVDAWRRSLEAPALPPDALWRPLALLRGKRGPEFAAARAGLADQAPSAPAARLLEGFDGSGYGAWSGTGLAFGEGPTRAGTLHLPGGAAPDGVIPAGVASSGSVSDRLHGTLRSASFSLPSPRLWIRAAGREGEI